MGCLLPQLVCWRCSWPGLPVTPVPGSPRTQRDPPVSDGALHGWRRRSWGPGRRKNHRRPFGCAGHHTLVPGILLMFERQLPRRAMLHKIISGGRNTEVQTSFCCISMCLFDVNNQILMLVYSSFLIKDFRHSHI